MATVGCHAAPEAAEQLRGMEALSLWPARRARRAAARQAADGRLAAAFARIVELEGELRRARAAAAAPAVPAAADFEARVLHEVELRLRLMAPCISHGVRAAMHEEEQGCEESRGAPPPAPSSLDVGRRNTAAHHFRVQAADIAQMGQQELNAVQREARRAGPRRSARRTWRDRPGGQLRQGRGAAGRGRADLPPRTAGAALAHRRVPAQRSASERVSTGWGVARRRGRSLPAGARFALAERVCSASQPPVAPLASGPMWWQAGFEDAEASVAVAHEGCDVGGSAGIDAPAPLPAAHGGLPHPLPDLPGPGEACSTACTFSPPVGAGPSIVSDYLMANEAALLCGSSAVATSGTDVERDTQEDGGQVQGQDRAPSPSSTSPRLGGFYGVAQELGEDGGGADGADGFGSVDGASATAAPARGPVRLFALRRHVYAATVALTVDRDIRRPGWQCDGCDVGCRWPRVAPLPVRAWAPVAGLGEQGAAAAPSRLSGPR
ncbi:unnamed protein product [Prorocentrum cordatum]|uniref:Uncharacterized protein n=1 Tax=Prorocentrum cordatum TaxID=2364126 RepID=A0ABN9YBR9_9DINO|nr:unnamed protein product [Polarella glacialis]